LPPGFVVWVNASTRQFESSELVDAVMSALRSAKGEWHFGLELTESVLIRDLDHAAALLTPLHERGVRLAIDDFGTGFSSLQRLRALPIDHLKIDCSFVKGVATEPADLAIVSACLGLGRGLGLDCVAEGIETKRQLEVLNDLGCASGQGYLFGRPMTSAQLEPILRAGRHVLAGVPRQASAPARLAGRL
jgi:EAL domain-containing protein (putative c-di-GMP-specific phosphodiesterase class I)